ncbi:MAG: glycoside hydrolase family 31 protein [Prevotellaceae bacterium]|jgi:alpha-glucosidase|nr:glycoside hydrolase family 31 protein [Prevotellaceae bacterium]
MIIRNILLTALLLLSNCSLRAAGDTLRIEPLADEYWWGGVVALGRRMPYLHPLGEVDLSRDGYNNQLVPLLLSSKGRYVWSDRPFRFTVGERSIVLTADSPLPPIAVAGSTLRDAYLDACRKHFPPSGTLPDTLFFSMPQYNTWIELMYNQNQTDILKYAQGIVDNHFPKGVLMIDDNWQKYYGNFDFKPERFADPKGMVEQLHAMGFKIMLWVCPFVSPDSPEYRELSSKGYLLRDQRGGTAIIQWWNGQSACYDLTNPAASAHLVGRLKQLQQEYGIDGFKFDAGDPGFYASSDLVSFRREATSVDHCEAWARIGLEFPFNEYRACWRMGGQPLVQRLGDKNNDWNAVGALIPDMLAAGLLGYAYTCPDMIGGGQYASYLNVDPARINQELIVRSAQVHTLMPMMQFSVAPWRILGKENLDILRNMAQLHERMGNYIIKFARLAAKTGEPIVRHMEYEFPGQGFAQCIDQFMLGDRYMVTPMLKPGTSRTVILPKGVWLDERGKKYRGGRAYTIDVPLYRLPYFEQQDK